MPAQMTADLVADALVMALWRRGRPRDLLHHSLMTEQGVMCSLSRSGNVGDNAAMESFFSSLKTERTTRKGYRTAMRHGPRCSTISRGSTISAAGIRHSL